MLSRIAEALYWMGRYLERADDTARLLDVYVHRMVVQANDDHLGVALLESMGIDVEQLDGLADVSAIDLWKATELLAYDADNPSSVVGSLRLARENARGLREILATEVWEALNRTHHELDQHVRAARTLGPHLLFQWVRDRVALVGGLIDTVLLHDDGWRFLTIGRCLERVDMTARLLGAVPADADASRWSGVLVSCGANDAFLRTYGGDIDRAKALSVLLLDPDFPRSVSYALAQAEQALDDVDGGQRGTSGRRRPLVRASAAAREVGRIRSELAYTDPVDLAAELPEVVARLQAATAHASELVTQRYFQRVAFIEWTPEKAGVSWRLQVVHTTRYRYATPVAQSYNEARLEPRSDRHQTVLSSRVEVEPATRVVRHVDYWGSVVHHFDIQTPHQELTVTGRTTVETATSPPDVGDATWADLDSDDLRDQFEELLVPTAIVTWNDEITEVARELRAASATPTDAAEAVTGWVHDRLTYSPGTTGVRTTATEVLQVGGGVCQDFAHVALALLRAMGVPAWYVSGYLHPTREAALDEPLVGESHAWVAAFTGSVWPTDPTSTHPVAERHVRVAAGRDYGDVTPFRGVYAGHASQDLEVSVELTRRA